MTKPDLIILHGALGSKEQFIPLASLLSDTHNVYTIDFEGHGARSTQAAYSIERFAKNLQELIIEKGLVKPHVFGYSMGGYVALYYASFLNRSLSSIFTLGTKFDWTPESAAKEVKMLDPDKIMEKVPAFAKALEQRHSSTNWKDVMHSTAQMMVQMGNNPPLNKQVLEGVECPVMITRGTEDKMVSEHESREVVGQIPGCNFYSFPDFKHPIEQVDIQKLVEKINSFHQEIEN